jgi:hypothetical protein
VDIIKVKMARWFSWNWAFEADLDPCWTQIEVLLEWLQLQVGGFVADERPVSEDFEV